MDCFSMPVLPQGAGHREQGDEVILWVDDVHSWACDECRAVRFHVVTKAVKQDEGWYAEAVCKVCGHLKKFTVREVMYVLN